MTNQKHPAFNNSSVTPIYQGVTYFFKDTEQVIQHNNNEIELGSYGRYDNPNWLEVEKKIALLDDSEDALIFSSGMNALTTTILAFAQAQDKLIFAKNCYRNSRNFCNLILPKFGVEVIPISSMSIQGFNNDFNKFYDPDRTRIVLVEVPSNPHLYLVDLENLKRKIGPNTLLIVDSTIGTPFNFKPRHFGADLVIQSCTKYISGHGDVMAGSVSGSKELIAAIRNYRNILGGIVDPHCAFLLNRSLETFNIRMKHFNDAGMKVAQYLEGSPLVKRVFYTGLDSHPHASLAKKYLTGHGGLLTFELEGDTETTSCFVDSLTVPFMGVNIGSNNSTVEQCSVFTYSKLSKQERYELGITDTLVRLGVGYGDVDLLLEDIEQALRKALLID